MYNCPHFQSERIDNAALKCLECGAIKRYYAVAFNVFSKRTMQWEPAPVEYCHAYSAGEAALTIIKGRSIRINVFAVGETIGFFVQDKHGEVLSAN